MLLRLLVLVSMFPTHLFGAVTARLRHDERGQATTEYALVLLGAALVALLLVAWATAGGGAGRIGRLLDTVLDNITSKV